MTHAGLLILVAILLCTLAPAARAEIAAVRIKGTRFLSGAAERVHCAARASSGASVWHRDVPDRRRFELDGSCPIAADLAGVEFAGREDQVVWFGPPTHRRVFVGTATGPTEGTASGELRLHADGSVSAETGALAYRAGPVLFVGQYVARCDASLGACGP